MDVKLAPLGCNRHQLGAAIGAIVGRMVHPGSELATAAAAGNLGPAGDRATRSVTGQGGDRGQAPQGPALGQL
ncbi:MAG: hypothetical protein KBH41_17820 [Azonexus sp.]|nr:hypothetical protein [Azonexus sp.]